MRRSIITFTVKRGQTFSVRVTYPEIEPGTRLASAKSNTELYDENRQVFQYRPRPGEIYDGGHLMSSDKSYYLIIYDTTKRIKYEFQIEDCFDAGSQTDAGGTIETAMEISEGKYQGYCMIPAGITGISEPDTRDVYKIRVNEGKILTINATYPFSIYAYGGAGEFAGKLIFTKYTDPSSQHEPPWTITQKIPDSDFDIELLYIEFSANLGIVGGILQDYTFEITTGDGTPTATTEQPTVTPTLTPTPMPGEDAFNYQGEYTLELDELRDEESKALPYVMNYASEYKVSPCLIMAVIRQESDFDASANGGADVGYMQVTYDAAKDGGYKDTEQEWQEKDGLDPELNIHYGTKYLMALNYIFNEGKLLTGDLKATKVPDTEERLKFVLAAYNGGAGRIAKAQQLCEEAGDDPEKWDDVKNYLEAAGATSEKAEIIKKYVDQVIEGRDLINGQRRGYEFFLTIRVPVGGASMPEEGVPGFEVVFAIAGFLTIAYLLKKRKLTR